MMDVGVGVFMPRSGNPRRVTSPTDVLFPPSAPSFTLQQQSPLRPTTLYSTFRVVLHEADCFVDPI